jgi:PAS domain S-box-containing protein
MSDFSEKKETLKSLIKRLHQGEDLKKIKEKFKELIQDTSSIEIAKIEEELIKEGMPQEEVHRLCDVHISLFKESIEKEKVLAPAGHPIHILMEEHKIVLTIADELKNASQKVGSKDKASAKDIAGELEQIQEKLKGSASHYLREENVLFPYLERHGITQPPAMMWMEHDKIREIEKNLYEFIDGCGSMDSDSFKKNLKDLSSLLAETLSSHFYKENNILFPTSLKVITDNEWKDVKKEFDELGYCSFTPESAISSLKETTEERAARPEVEGIAAFSTGNLSHEEIEAIFNSLPVELTFVDKEDMVRYFSQTKERIFTRTKAVIGRTVQQCHPQKSIQIVNQILEDFKAGRRDVAEFWLHLDRKLIHIRYLPVRSEKGEYLGCLEVTQDITNLKSIEGEKRLLS